MNYFVFAFFLTLMISTFDEGYSFYGYFAYIIIFFASLIGFRSYYKNYCSSRFNLFSLLVVCVIFSWGYGFLIGVINDNELNFIIRNFSGLLLYIFYFVFIRLNPSINGLYFAVFFTFILQFLYLLLNFEIANLLNFPSQDAGSISDYRLNYSVGYIFAFPIFSLCVYNFFFNEELKGFSKAAEKTLQSKIVFLGVCFLLFLATMSKGFILAGFLIASYIFYYWLCFTQEKKIRKFKILVFLCLIIIGFLYFKYDYVYLLISSFGLNESGNSIRNEQAFYLIREIDFFGNGLGSTLHSGYKRDDDGYGFELTYLNIIHKLGVLAVPLFVLYIYTWFCIFKSISNKNTRGVGIFSLGCISYQVVGVGNPILLSPLCVALHIVSMYLMTIKRGIRFE